MMNPCFCCGRHYPGLNWTIPDEDWIAIAGRLDAGEMCPWCADRRLVAAGRVARAQVSLSLDGFNALNMAVIAGLEALDGRIQREKTPC